MHISVKTSLLILLILPQTFTQIYPISSSPTAARASTTVTYMAGVNGPTSVINVPSAYPFTSNNQTSTTTVTSTPPTQFIPPITTSTTTTTNTNTNKNPTNPSTAPQTDQIPPNTFTDSSQLQNQPSTTSPQASSILNNGYYNYQAATAAYSSLSQLNKVCNAQNQLKFVAFRQHSTQFYLTPNTYFLSLLQANSPNRNQLFIASQNIDCTWSFQTSDGLYLSVNTAFNYLTLSPSLSSDTRFYLERSSDWLYVESASSYRYFWTASNGILLMNFNQASRFLMEMWPDLYAGWNWLFIWH